MAIFFNDQRLTHMSKGDAYLWSKFLNKYPDYFSNIRYDVRVGKSVKLKQDDPEWLKKSADSLSRKRIDIVANRDKITFVIEVRVRAKSNVVGELINYVQLYKMYYPYTNTVSPLLITDAVEADLLLTLQNLQIPFYIV
jgi:hypothetical protein